MARFTYYWKTGRDDRHEGEIDAPDRETAFAMLRERGIRAIKVEPKGWETGKGFRGVRKRMVVLAGVVCLVLGVVVTYSVIRRARPTTTVMTPAGPVTYRVASPLERQQISGDRQRIENLPTNLFSHVAEFYLAAFAEPGRAIPSRMMRPPANEAVLACLNKPIYIASNDFTEYADLKRIVAGMKRELKAYIAGGETVSQYCVELVKRQKMEQSYRTRAENRLEELMKEAISKGSGSPDAVGNLKEAYSYWLKANASLEAMGIYPLPLPSALRTYQMSLDIDADLP